LNHTQAWRVAVHESGHVLLASLLPSFADVVSTELLWSASDQAWHGFTLTTCRTDSGTYHRDRTIMAMSGIAAELIIFTDVVEGASRDDLQSTSSSAERWLRTAAESTSPLPSAVCGLSDELKNRFLMSMALSAAGKVIRANRGRHERLALQLLDLEKLTETQIARLLL